MASLRVELDRTSLTTQLKVAKYQESDPEHVVHAGGTLIWGYRIPIRKIANHVCNYVRRIAAGHEGITSNEQIQFNAEIFSFTLAELASNRDRQPG